MTRNPWYDEGWQRFMTRVVTERPKPTIDPALAGLFNQVTSSLSKEDSLILPPSSSTSEQGPVVPPMGPQSTYFVPATLPYIRPGFERKLPSQEQICSLPPHRDNRRSYCMVTYDQRFLIKYGPGAREHEGQTLLFVEQYLNIPAPLLYAMWRDGEHMFIVMQHMPGQNLHSVWHLLGNEARTSIVDQLGQYVQAMRSLKPVSRYFCGSVDGTSLPFVDHHHRKLTAGVKRSGFHDRQGFYYYLCCIWAGMESPFITNRMIEWDGSDLALSLADSGSVFTHGALNQQNIMLTNDESGYKVSIVGWAASGWMPQCFEWISTRYNTSGGYYDVFLPRAIPVFPEELEKYEEVEYVMTKIRQDWLNSSQFWN